MSDVPVQAEVRKLRFESIRDGARPHERNVAGLAGACLVCAALVIGPAHATAEPQERADVPPPSIHVTGEATLTVQPDQAVIDLGVVTQAEESAAAARRNVERLETVRAKLRGVMAADGTLETIAYTLNPEYQDPSEAGEPRITGYTATNIIRVTLNNLKKVGAVIDAATAAGANRIRALRFTLRDERAAHQRALREAAANATAEAHALAAALGVKAGRVLSASETGPPVLATPGVTFARAQMVQPSTPIDPGPIEIRASVSLTFELRSW